MVRPEALRYGAKWLSLMRWRAKDIETSFQWGKAPFGQSDGGERGVFTDLVQRLSLWNVGQVVAVREL